MDMDPLFFDSSACINVDNLPIDSHAFSHCPDQDPGLPNGFLLDEPFLDLKSSDSAFLSNQVEPVDVLPSKSIDLGIGDLAFPPTSVSLGGGPFGSSMSSCSTHISGKDFLPPPGDNDSSDPVLKYISQMLMEENMEEQPWVLLIRLLCKVLKNRCPDALGQQHVEQSDQNPSKLYLSHYIESPTGDTCSAHGSHDARNVTVSSSDSADANILDTIGEHRHALQQNADLDFQSIVYSSFPPLSNSLSSIMKYDDGSEESLLEFLVKSIFGDGESMIQFKKGLEEARKFLPTNNRLAINPEDSKPSSETERGTTRMRIHEKINMKGSPNGFKGLKNHERDEDAFEEGRANKLLRRRK